MSFRLSQEEYSELCALCAAQRARSISDFVRDNMHWILEQGEGGVQARAGQMPPPAVGPTPPCMARPTSPREVMALSELLLSLNRRTDELDRRVRQLAELVEMVAGGVAADEAQPVSR